MKNKKKLLMVFQKKGQNGGPYISHKRIMESKLSEKYNFIPFYVDNKKKNESYIKYIRNLVKEIKKYDADCIQIPGLQLIGFNISLAAFIAKVKKRIIVIHGSSMEAQNFNKFKKKIMYVLENLSLFFCTDFFCVSKYVSSWKWLKKYNKKNRGVVYNLPPIITKNGTSNIREELKIEKNKKIVVTTARITKEKGFDTLAKVIKKYNNNKVCFLIVGDGDYLKELKNNLKQEIINKKVYFLGYRTDIINILSGSDIFVMLSHHETLSISLLEAASLDMPLIGTNVGGIPEIIQNDFNGFLVNNYEVNNVIEKIDFLIKNNNGTMIGMNNKKAIKKFSNKIIETQLEEIYEDRVL